MRGERVLVKPLEAGWVPAYLRGVAVVLVGLLSALKYEFWVAPLAYLGAEALAVGGVSRFERVAVGVFYALLSALWLAGVQAAPALSGIVLAFAGLLYLALLEAEVKSAVYVLTRDELVLPFSDVENLVFKERRVRVGSRKVILRVRRPFWSRLLGKRFEEVEVAAEEGVVRLRGIPDGNRVAQLIEERAGRRRTLRSTATRAKPREQRGSLQGYLGVTDGSPGRPEEPPRKGNSEILHRKNLIDDLLP
ncbi:hypothetical protein [Thermofilum pendens]|uniref:Uncharacterized protein n=1 Tax=Thermofilum pendens (strain DSM 2475 / Hrk 5) TaxID=368408 RepID=A1S164_THEPD|nr:hypothetical protein [Thermofilum pendens]ABL79194.1 hypothetical protein Tpen_1799 [Thermofilum pendens Hrk 5]